MKLSSLVPFGIPALFMVGVAVWWTLPTPEGVRANRLTRAALQVPVGSTKAQVAAMLHKQGMGDQSIYYSAKDGDLEFNSDVRDSGYKSSFLSGYYCVYVHNSSRALIGQCSTYAYFFFDKKSRLLKATTQKRCIGL